MAGENINVNIIADREVAMMAKLQAHFARKNMRNVKIQPFEIRVEKQLTANDTNFLYKLAQRSNQTNRENYLSDNDGFVMLGMSIGIIKVPTNLTGAFDRGGNVSILNYPDPNLFNAAATAANVSEANALEAIYNGYLTAKSDTEEVLYQLETARFRKVPYFQWSSTTRPSYDGQQYQPVPMPIIFEGKKTNEFNLYFAPGADTVQINGADAEVSVNRLVILHRGLVIRNQSEPATYDELRALGFGM